MKKNNLLLFFVVLLLGAGIVACSDDFLEAPPQGALDAGTLANEQGADAAVISAYSMLDGWAESWGSISSPWPASGSNWIWGSVMSDDAHKGSEAGDQGQTEELELFQWAPGNSYFNDKFIILYEGIARANAAIALVKSVENLDPDKARQLEAEARFLRAHFHFDGWKLWKNIPYYTEEDTEFRKPNNEDIVPKIIADFEFAADALPATQGQVGRATSGAANAYLGRVYMFVNDYSNAKSKLDAVVNSGNYDLSPCFNDIFNIGSENGPEMVFSIQASVNDGTSEGQNGMFGDRLNFPHGGSPFGCCGFHQPTQNLVNAHRVDDNGLPLFDTFNDTDVDENFTGPLDPRVDWTVGRDGIPFLDHGTHEPSWIRARSFQGPYSPKKFSYRAGQNQQSGGWVSTQLSPVNFPIIRYSDVLLMLAEAEVEVGSLERARELTNLVRGRAGNCAQGADGGTSTLTDGAAYANYSVSTYDDAWTDKNAARDAVRYERRLELALEGHRFFDLRRWGIAAEVLNKYIEEEKPKRAYLNASAGYQSPKNDLFPIPTQQIELSKIDGEAQLTQNPGF
ncbi:MAG: RagB/SusD family nutrient uptake outer membrane protein [Bacteroidota bacterium]